MTTKVIDEIGLQEFSSRVKEDLLTAEDYPLLDVSLLPTEVEEVPVNYIIGGTSTGTITGRRYRLMGNVYLLAINTSDRDLAYSGSYTANSALSVYYSFPAFDQIYGITCKNSFRNLLGSFTAYCAPSQNKAIDSYVMNSANIGTGSVFVKSLIFIIGEIND